jgi:hypothetical protein
VQDLREKNMRYRTLKVVGLVETAALLAALGGCPLLAGCQSAGKLTPEQIQSIGAVADVVSKAAKDNGVKGFGYVELEPVYGETYQGFRLGGVRARVFIYADPAAGTPLAALPLPEP